MDYDFRWSKVRIEPRIGLARDIAITDVFREFGGGIPDDAVLLYLMNCDCSGIKDCIFESIDSCYWNHESPVTEPKKRPIRIPDALRKMADEYFISAVLQELCGCCYGYDEFGYDTEKLDAIPKAIGDVLNSIQVTNHAELMDHKPIIDAVRAVIANESIKVTEGKSTYPSTYTRRLSNEMWAKHKFEAITGRQRMTLHQLATLRYRMIDKLRLTRKLPSKYEWDTFCNLLDILLVMYYKGGYNESSNMFTIHEYAKMAEVGRERTPKFEDLSSVSRMRDLWSAQLDKALDLYSRLSPMASVMIGRHGRLSRFGLECENPHILPMWGWEEHIFRSYLENKPAGTSTAVKLFMKYEIAIQRLKLEGLARQVAKYNRENGRSDYIRECDCAEDCDCPCCCG